MKVWLSPGSNNGSVLGPFGQAFQNACGAITGFLGTFWFESPVNTDPDLGGSKK